MSTPASTCCGTLLVFRGGNGTCGIDDILRQRHVADVQQQTSGCQVAQPVQAESEMAAEHHAPYRRGHGATVVPVASFAGEYRPRHRIRVTQDALYQRLDGRTNGLDVDCPDPPGPFEYVPALAHGPDVSRFRTIRLAADGGADRVAVGLFFSARVKQRGETRPAKGCGKQAGLWLTPFIRRSDGSTDGKRTNFVFGQLAFLSTSTYTWLQ